MEKVKVSFEDLIKSSETPVLVDFFATWCGPCQMMQPVLSELATEFSDKIKIIKVDVDKNPGASNAFKVSGVPTFILFYKGQVKWRQSGAIPGFEFKKIISNYIKNSL